MEFIINYWKEILSVLFILAIVVFFCITQTNKVKEWLLYAVVEAEEFLGSSTGQLKLVWVYDMFIERFKWVSVIMPYSIFAILVDGALDTMKDMLDGNEAVANIVKGEK